MASFDAWIKNGSSTGTASAVPVYATASLPTPTAGLIAKLSDGNKGLVYANGTAWVPAESQQVWTLENFGGAADGTTDNLAAWNSIMSLASQTLSGSGPSGPVLKLQTGIYHFSDTPSMTIPCILEGSGSAYSAARTIIDLPAGKQGMIVTQTAIINGSQGAVLKNFVLQSSNNPSHRADSHAYVLGDVIQPPVSAYGNYTGWGDTGYLYVCTTAGTSAGSAPASFLTRCNTDATRTESNLAPFSDGSVTWTPVQCHGMVVGAGLMTFENVLVQGFAGDGWHCYGDTTNTSTDLCRFLRIHAINNSGSGFYDAGADSSVIYVESGNFIANGGWAVKDLGYLGNTYISCHCRSNGTGGGGGGVWIANNAGWTVGSRAGPTQQNGYLYGVTSITTGITGATEPTWPTTLGNTVTSGGVTYTCLRAYDGGSYSNRDSVFVGCYSEADSQPSGFGSAGQGAFYQGFHGAGFQADQGVNVSGLVEFGRYTNSRASKSAIVDPGQGYGTNVYFGPPATDPVAFGAERYLLSTGNVIAGSGWVWQYRHTDGYWYLRNVNQADGAIYFGLPTDAATDTAAGPIFFPNNIKLSQGNTVFNTSTLPTTATRGDICINTAYSTGTAASINNAPFGWVCNHTSAGSATWTPLAARRAPVQLQQADKVMASLDTGTVYNSVSSGALVKVTAFTDIGSCGTLVVGDANGMRLVAPAGGWQIQYGSLFCATTGYFESTQVGATISWVTDNSSKGITVTALTGAWNIDGTPITFINQVGVEGRLASAVVDSSLGTKQNLYTVPTGYKCVVTKAIVRTISGAVTTATTGLGFNANATDVITAMNIPTATGTYQCNTVVGGGTAAVLGNAADVLGVKFSVTDSRTMTVEVFGYLY